MDKSIKKVGVAGYGAIGKPLCDALESGSLPGFTLAGISSLNHSTSFEELIERSDVIVEALPPDIVPELAIPSLMANKTLILASTGTLLTYPEILGALNGSAGCIIGPYGALAKIPDIKSLKNMDIQNIKIVSTKPPAGFGLDISERQLIFSGSAKEAVAKYGKNANVSASLAFGCSFDGEEVLVEIWADPEASGNSHRVIADTTQGHFEQSIINRPDPNNPKTSIGTAESVIDALINPDNAFFVLDRNTVDTDRLVA